MKKAQWFKWVLCLLLFAMAFAVRYPLVDRYYEYSFEADSRRCVEETRSFYFYFKHPIRENFPDPLNTYPNYSDGDYIASALLANCLRPIFKSGIVSSNLGDGDNTLIIFSMRWAGVLFDAAAACFVFLMLLLITSNAVLSFAVCILYYLLSSQALNVDLIRIDHYGLFATSFGMWAGLSVLYFPVKQRYYLFAGLAAGLVTATKINFPFYLLLPILALLLLLYQKRTNVYQLLNFTVAFLLTFVFMYQRWLLYPENIYSTLISTLLVGEQWYAFWGNGNYLYYLWHQFFEYGFSYFVIIFLVCFYLSFFLVTSQAIAKRSALLILLSLAFATQILLLTLSPKVGRYGMIVPVWVSLFIGLALSEFKRRLHLSQYYMLVVVFLLPICIYSLSGHRKLREQAENRELSIRKTRVEAAAWMTQHIKPGSIIGLQLPEVSYPPIFESPYVFSSKHLQYPFLIKDELAKLSPPKFSELRGSFNYLVISNKEQDFHLLTLKQYQLDKLHLQWQQFYTSLGDSFSKKCFEAAHENYGVNKVCAYHISDSLLYPSISEIKSWSRTSNDTAELFWSYEFQPGSNAYAFQLEVSDDSSMRWLSYGSRSGVSSKYRTLNQPVAIDIKSMPFTPNRIARAFDEGKFDGLLGGVEGKYRKAEIDNFFAGILVELKNERLTFQEALKNKMHGEETAFASVIRSLYHEDILKANLSDYLTITGLSQSAVLSSDKRIRMTWKFAYPISADGGYWRVRAKDGSRIMSEWSPVIRL